MSDNQESADSFDEGAFEAMLGKDSEALPEGQVSLWKNLMRAFKENRPGILVKGVIIAEVIDEEGNRGLCWSYPDDMMGWEILGMTDQVRADIKAENQVHVLAAFQEDDEDDDA